MLMQFQPEKEHQWLQKLVGDWTYEIEATMGADKPVEKFAGSESGRLIGDFWVQCEGRGQMCDASDTGGTAITVMTRGIRPAQRALRCTWLGSMMALSC
jgi:hypothetical protein